MNEIESIIKAAPYLQKAHPHDCCVLICDVEGMIVYFLPARTFHTTAIVGNKVSSTGALARSLQSRKEEFVVVPKEAYGYIHKAVATPIFQNGELIGAVGTGTSLESQEVLYNAAHLMASTSQQLSATTEELASMATQLSQDIFYIQSSGKNVLSYIEKTDDILKFVNKVAADSNLLGLNAAIEAARAGQHGRTFAVVAEEIRKMAINSVEAVVQIKNILQEIQKETFKLVDTVGKTSELGERQAAATEEISASMQQLASTAIDIEKVAEVS
ncbi:methyl-accepting chemotaxis protein [Sporomusa sp. KB1]|uniref:methyl-accepting chemotaxis protein n=1 Tax=Sporomusa sp. KB1 TaxID=943346 RepID=UPI00119EE068|nr:methyl-accepting chemotaxis protein [Sporomusa sp. KB1]TWH45522.1 Methyl-accepting chemotaxis protein [Sporomusa sp. KB1]